MDSGRFIFDSSPSHAGHMLFRGDVCDPIFQGARSFLVFKEGANKQRPFFTTAEELMDEEYYDGQVTEKKHRLTAEQVHLLEKSFEAENKLESERKSELAKKLGLQPRQVAVWFQNRRARCKTKQLENEFDCLKSSYDALVSNRDSLLQDNNRLQSQVVSLTEKLRELAMAGLQLAEKGEHDDMQEHLSPPASPVPVLHLQRGEERLSTGSKGRAVIDSEATALLLDSGGDSYFQESLIEEGIVDCCVGAVDGLLGSEKDGCSSYFPDGIFVEDAHEDHWWVWS